MVDQGIGDGDQGNNRALHPRHRPLDRQHDRLGRDPARDEGETCLAGIELPVSNPRRECLVKPHHHLAGQPPHAQRTRQTELEFLDVG